MKGRKERMYRTEKIYHARGNTIICNVVDGEGNGKVSSNNRVVAIAKTLNAVQHSKARHLKETRKRRYMKNN